MLLTGGLLALLCAELVARACTTPPVWHNRMRFDAELGFRKLPSRGTNRDERGEFPFRLNALGFRGPLLPTRDHPVPKTPGTPRLLFVGDSFVVAYAVRDEEHMANATVAELERRGTPAEAYVAACSDYGTAQELLLLRQVMPDVRPDCVVLVVYPSNDVANNSIELFGRSFNAPGDYLRPYFVPDGRGGLDAAYPHAFRGFLRRHSMLFSELEHRLVSRAEREGWDGPRIPSDPRSQRERVVAGELPRERFEVFRDHPRTADWSKAWVTTEALVRAARDEVERAGARLLVLVVPKSHQVVVDAHRVFLDRRIAGWDGEPLDGVLDWNLPERRFHDLFARDGMDGALLLDDLRAAAEASAEPLYSYDFHLTGRAHGIAARLVADWVGRSTGVPFLHPEEVPSGSPVDVLELHPAPSPVDFRTAAYRELTADGHGVWQPAWFGGAGGVPLRNTATLVVRRPAGADAFVLGGAVPPRAELPYRVTLRLDEHPVAELELAQAGEFERRIPSADLPADLADRVLVELSAATAFQVDDLDYAFVLHRLGFDAGATNDE